MTKNMQQLITFLLISETLPNNNLFKTKTLKYQFYALTHNLRVEQSLA